jgi:hypothetical protein
VTEEILLTGGRTQQVVRVGDTVRRAPHANAMFVRELLASLEKTGFDAVPRWLGVDERGREIFSFVEGQVPPELGHFDLPVFSAAARFIRGFHDATARFCDGGRVVCHNDLSPCNFAFRDGVPAAIIDFDLAAEGERLFDLGFAAWTWLDLGNDDDYSDSDQAERLRAFAAAYGPEIDAGALVEAVLLRQTLLENNHFNLEDPGVRAWARACRETTQRIALLF